MSTQETRLAAIADAIRAKDGTAAPICANDFAERIRALQAGGGGTTSGGSDITVLTWTDPEMHCFLGYIRFLGTAPVEHVISYEVLERTE